jgi:cysteine desulfurase / selenocysteine lyase
VPTVKGQALQRPTRFARFRIRERKKPIADSILDGANLPQIVPTIRQLLGTEHLLEIAIGNPRLSRIGKDSAILFRDTRHGHEERGLQRLLLQLAIALGHANQILLVALADGNDHLALFYKLIDERLWNCLGGTCHDNFVEGCRFGPALITIAAPHMHVDILQTLERLLGTPRKPVDNFNRVDFFHKRAEHCRLVSAPRADLQHAIPGLRIELLGHVGHDVRRRNRLRVTNRQGGIKIGLRLPFLEHEFVPRCTFHYFEHPRIFHPRSLDFLIDHLFTKLGKILGMRTRSIQSESADEQNRVDDFRDQRSSVMMRVHIAPRHEKIVMNHSIEQTRERLRAAMPVARKWVYFDHAAVAPLSQPASDAIAKWLAQAAEEGDTTWLDWAAQLSGCRQAAAQLIGAGEDEIALLPNTTAGINLVAEGLDWQPGDNVVTLADEFPTNLYPWMNLEKRGVLTRFIPTDCGRVTPEQIAEHCDERTRVVSVSWICYSNGCRRALKPIADVAHDCGALFLVDAIQGLGVFPLNVQADEIDVLAADGHKWLLGPEGAGIAFIHSGWLERLQPLGLGWNSVVNAGNFDQIELKLKPNASRYEGGTYNMAGFIGLGASMKLLLSLGVENMAATILDFTDKACEQLSQAGAVIHSPRHGDSRSGIVSFEIPQRDPQHFRKTCLAQGVALNCRAGRLRLSAHAYNNDADLQRLLEILKS